MGDFRQNSARSPELCYSIIYVDGNRVTGGLTLTRLVEVFLHQILQQRYLYVKITYIEIKIAIYQFKN
jgi:hypothetical protein